jgi:plastocyanin
MKPHQLALMLAPLAAVAGCGGSDAGSRPPGPNEVVMTEFKFDPAARTVKRGTQLSVRNDGQIAHDLTVVQPAPSDRRLIGTDTLISGDSGKLGVDLPSGRYRMVCTVPGHERRGMAGTLRVR